MRVSLRVLGGWSCLAALVLSGWLMAAEDALPAATPENQKKSEELFKEGQALQKNKDFKAMTAKWAEAVQLDPRNWQAANYYAWFIGVDAPQEMRDTKKAMALALQAARVTEWHNKDVLDTVAEVYFQTGDFAKAVETGQKALAPNMDGHSPEKYLKEQLLKFEKALAEAHKK